jgi:hypothetical protein
MKERFKVGGSAPFVLTKKMQLLLTKRELAIVEGGSPREIKLHSPYRIKQYIKLSRNLREKYRDLTRRQKVKIKHSQGEPQNLKTMDKARIFDKVLSAFELQSQKVKAKSISRVNQEKLDHDQHYDLDGVTRIAGKVVIPSNLKIKRRKNDRPNKSSAKIP